ncbi:DDE family endonuclease, partial [Rhizoctonia solani AG-3 Rhs1AP]
MPPKSKKQLAAMRCEQQKIENKRNTERPIVETYSPPRYKPLNASCQPYWDAFYENPYPNVEECKKLSERLNLRPKIIQQWFAMARRFTYAPDRGPLVNLGETDEHENGEASGAESEDSEDEEISIEGTLYEHFYQSVIPKRPKMRSLAKRKRSSTIVAAQEGNTQPAPDLAIDSELNQSKRAHQQGPQGSYSKQSRTTLWRKQKHALENASDIRTFFSAANRPAKAPRTESSAPMPEIEHIILDSDSDSVPEVMFIEKKNDGGLEPSAVDVLGLDVIELGPVITDSQVIEAEDTDPEPPRDNRNSAGESKSLGGSGDGSISLETYLRALEILEASMSQLKINIPLAIDPPDSQDILQSMEDYKEPNAQPPYLLDAPVELLLPMKEVAPQEEGPTLQDAEDALVEPLDVDMLEEVDEDERDEPFDVTLTRHLGRLLSIEKKSKKPSTKYLLDLTMLSDYNNLRKAYINAGHKSPSVLASNRIAEIKFVPSSKKPTYQHECWFARRLRVKANHLVRFGCLPDSKQGKGATHYSMLSEEDVKRSILSYLRTLKAGTISPMRLRRAVNQKILPELGITSPISDSTARRWIAKLGYRPVQHSKGMYIDGHERSDVVEYRKGFLEIIKSLQPLMQQYDDETDEPLPLNLPEGQKRHVPIGHDECCFHANDRENTIWLRDGEQQLRQKGRGRIIHVSDFIVEQSGRLALTPEMIKANENLPTGERLKVTDARKIIEPGKNHDKWWDMDQLCDQVSDTLKIFDRMYPNCTGVFFFDQSSAHNAFADDALVANRMNVKAGGKNAKPMHDTFIPMNNPNPQLRGKLQSMVYPPGHEDAGKPKGMRDVLDERGLLATLHRGSKGQPVGVCSVCRQSEEARSKAEKNAREQMESDPTFYRSLEDTGLDDDMPPQCQARSSTCCMRRCLSLQQDFLDEKPRIQVLIERAGHRCIFLPKFHCELNPIEMYWGYSKRLFREQSDGTITTARKLVVDCLNAASVQTIRHFWRKSWRYMDAYMNGLTGMQAEFAVKKFKSHRRIGKRVMMNVTSVLN